MTVGGWIRFFSLAGVLLFFGILIAYTSYQTSIKAISISSAIILVICLLFGMLFYYNSTAAGKRAFKSQESNFNDGIERIVEVYDATGNLLKKYEGKFDIDYDDDRIIFDDENGKRHVIYYPTGTVIVDEK